VRCVRMRVIELCLRGPSGPQIALTDCVQDDFTVLMFAVWNGHTATAAELVRGGALINAKDKVCIRCSCATTLSCLFVSPCLCIWACEALSWGRLIALGRAAG
jgi:hypothetical protein